MGGRGGHIHSTPSIFFLPSHHLTTSCHVGPLSSSSQRGRTVRGNSLCHQRQRRKTCSLSLLRLLSLSKATHLSFQADGAEQQTSGPPTQTPPLTGSALLGYRMRELDYMHSVFPGHCTTFMSPPLIHGRQRDGEQLYLES